MFDPRAALTDAELLAYHETGDLVSSITNEQTWREIGKHLGIEFLGNEIPLPDSEDEKRFLQKLVSAKFGSTMRAVPWAYQVNENGELSVLKVAMQNPFENLPINLLAQQYPNVRIDLAYASESAIEAGLNEVYGLGGKLLDDMIADGSLDSADQRTKEVEIDPNDDDATARNFVNKILEDAVKRRATDIHIEPKDRDLQIRYRVDGKLVPVTAPAAIIKIKNLIISRIKILSGLNISESRKSLDGRISLRLPNLNNQRLDARVVTLPTIEGEGVVVRILGQREFSMDTLDLNLDFRRQVEELLAQPNGIILVTGPTGCGKSTTLFGFLSTINKPGIKIVTIEDPVENKLPNATQLQVEGDIGVTFATHLKSVLRSDPDVIMVGEMRDKETSEIAVQAALTGHLVFSTLHTNDSISGITRLVNIGVAPYLVANAVRAILAQRLVRRLCPHCSVPKSYNPEYLDYIGFPKNDRATLYSANPDGCAKCDKTGFFERIAIYEIFMVNEALQELISRDADIMELRDTALKNGFKTMREYGWQKVIGRITSIEEILENTES